MKTSLAVSLLLLGLILCLSAEAQEDSTAIPIDPTTISSGPFISWLTDSLLQVDYICAGERQQDTVPVDSQAIIPRHCLDFLPGGLVVKRQPFLPAATAFTNIEHFLVVSDVHGEYAYLVDFLKKNQVIDDSLSWSWGTGHLVLNGDIFDRGDKVYETLWLIYSLQQQAQSEGGMVHLVMGNHELMVLRGDERYLNPVYTEVILPVLETTHQALLVPGTILGDWLRGLPAILTIDSLLFVHGGISMELMRTGMTIEEINRAAHRYLDISSDSLKADSLASLLYKSEGPFWNRTMVWEYNAPQITGPEFDSILEYFEVSRIIVGHSEHDSVTALFNGHLFAIDIPVEESGGFEGLLFENDRFYRVTPDGQKHPLDSMISSDTLRH